MSFNQINNTISIQLNFLISADQLIYSELHVSLTMSCLTRQPAPLRAIRQPMKEEYGNNLK